MRTVTLVAALTASGLLGGVAGALLVQGLAGPAAAPTGRPSPDDPASGRDPAVERELAAVRARLDEVQASVGSTAGETARVREELAAERKASAEARGRLEAVEAASARPNSLRMAQGGEFPLAGRVAGGDGTFVIAGREDPAFAERMRKAAELRGKSEEERWAAARDALGLAAYQEEELKAALKERNQAIRDAMKVESKDHGGGDGTASVTVSVPDASKMVEARRKYDDRVNATLNADQQKKWRDEGYEGALGGGMRSMTFATVQTEGVPVLPEAPK